MSSSRSFGSSEIPEKALLVALPKIKDVFGRMEESIRESFPRLVRPGYELNDDESEASEAEASEAEASEAAEAEASEAAESPSKRSRTSPIKASSRASSKARPEFTMEMGLDLKITDTDTNYAIFAHKFLLSLLESSSESTLLARNCGLSFIGRALAALSTPAAAFYVDLTPEAGVHAALLTDTTDALRREVTDLFLQERIGANPRLLADFVTRRDRRSLRCDAELECFESFDRMVNLAMGKYTSHLEAMRVYWKSKPVPVVNATIVKTLVVSESQPQPPSWKPQLPARPRKVEIMRLRLPLSVVPLSCLGDTCSCVHDCLSPSAEEVEFVKTLDCSGTLDMAKYCLMNWILSNDQGFCDKGFGMRQVLESRTANFLVVRHELSV